MRLEAVVRPDPLARRVDEAGLAQFRHVMGDRRLRDREGGGEVANADRLLRLAEAEDDLHARRIGERLEHRRELLGACRRDLEVDAAAHTPFAHGKDGSHESSLADPLTTINGYAHYSSRPVYGSRRCGVNELQES